jgi:hypothetical protein
MENKSNKMRFKKRELFMPFTKIFFIFTPACLILMALGAFLVVPILQYIYHGEVYFPYGASDIPRLACLAMGLGVLISVGVWCEGYLNNRW